MISAIVEELPPSLSEYYQASTLMIIIIMIVLITITRAYHGIGWPEYLNIVSTEYLGWGEHGVLKRGEYLNIVSTEYSRWSRRLSMEFNYGVTLK